LHAEIVGDAKWRWFCRIYDHPVPNHSTLCDRERLVRPASLHALNDRLIRLGQECRVTQGRKLRTDGTVIETNIQYPTDSRLLSDSARVLGRLCSEARELLHPQTVADKQLFRNRARRAQRLARQIAQRLRGPKGKKRLEPKRKNRIAHWSGWSKRCWHRSSTSRDDYGGTRASGP
jgi:IS5 family transposase